MKKIMIPNTKFIISGVIYGEKVCIHSLDKDMYLTSLNFDEFTREVINIEKKCPSDLKSKIYHNLLPVINNMIEIERARDYSYLFLANDNKIKLINYSISEIAQNYRSAKSLSKTIGVEQKDVIWEGIYTRQVEAGFYEDIIVQLY